MPVGQGANFDEKLTAKLINHLKTTDAGSSRGPGIFKRMPSEYNLKRATLLLD
jgi:hypothetical protein